MTVLVTERTSLSTDRVYRIVYTNLLYFIVMFLVPLVILLILNGELIRVLRDKKAKRAQLLRGRSSSRPASISVAAEQQTDVDTRRWVDANSVVPSYTAAATLKHKMWTGHVKWAER